MGINWPRKFFHLGVSLFLFLLSGPLEERGLKFLLSLLLIGNTFWEVLRLKRPSLLPLKGLWVRLLKDKEKNCLSDAFWFLLGLWIASWLAPFQVFKLLILILGIADPLAEISGKTLKGKRLYRGKTFTGTLAFFLSSFLLALWYFKAFSLTILLFCVFLSLIELFSERDNFWIPLAGSLLARVFLTT